MRKLMLLITLIASTVLVKDLYAMRCNYKLILKGDSVLKVVRNCGRPIYSQRIIRNNRFMTLFIYELNNREKRVFLRNGVVVGVIE